MKEVIVKETDLEVYFYVPGIFSMGLKDPAQVIREFFDRMREEVDEFAPLRTYILEIKDYTPTVTSEWVEWECCIADELRRPIDVWKQLCFEHYNPELLWLPSNQIEFRGRQ